LPSLFYPAPDNDSTTDPTLLGLLGDSHSLDFNVSTIAPTAPIDPLPWANLTDSTVKYQFPVAALTLFDVVFLIAFIPIMDWIQRCLDQTGKVIPILLRFYVGILFALFAVVWAGVLETKRLHVYWDGCVDGQLPPWNFSYSEFNSSCANCINQTIHKNTTYNAADMSVAFQVPQYCFIGISEAFASVAGLEFAYNSAPRCMQGLVMGFFWLFTGVGSLLGSGLAAALRGHWFHYHPSFGLNYDRLDYYYYLLAGILSISFFFFFWAKSHGADVDRKRQYIRRKSMSSQTGTQYHDDATTYADPPPPRRTRSRVSRSRPPRPRDDNAAYLRVEEEPSQA